ncbi:MAG: MBOAT family protein [Clostridia bacterium]|nr:MBOAT family protein [Clostridia bacterium]
MLFSSNVFLYFYLPVVLLLYYISPRQIRNFVLFAVSLFFYGWGEPVYLFLMVFTVLINYVCAFIIDSRRKKEKSTKSTLVIGVVLNLLLLGYFKYATFFLESLQSILPFMKDFDVPEITLPIGISFYVFQSMSYLIDVYRDDAPVQKNPITFGTYVALFPQLIAGPIVRYTDVARQLSERKENLDDFASGIKMFIIGLAKKILIANQMGALWETIKSADGTVAAWVGIAAYSLQLYFDFSGYSDMAIGLGRMFGFEFLINFNYPYISNSITDFWRRWHMSLSTWFKEYVYIPLGGNRKGIKRQIINLLIVWALTGFWHGASWNFLFWGIYYSILLIIEKTFLLKVLDKLPKFVRHIYTIIIVILGWALFYFVDTAELWEFIKKLFTPAATSSADINTILAYVPLLVVAAVASTPLGARLYNKVKESTAKKVVTLAGLAVMMLLCVCTLVSQSYNPFIYFRF